jgi:hypothetical protein
VLRVRLGGDDSMQFRAVQAMFCTKLGAPCSSLLTAQRFWLITTTFLTFARVGLAQK